MTRLLLLFAVSLSASCMTRHKAAERSPRPGPQGAIDDSGVSPIDTNKEPVSAADLSLTDVRIQRKVMDGKVVVTMTPSGANYDFVRYQVCLVDAPERCSSGRSSTPITMILDFTQGPSEAKLYPCVERNRVVDQDCGNGKVVLFSPKDDTTGGSE